MFLHQKKEKNVTRLSLKKKHNKKLMKNENYLREICLPIFTIISMIRMYLCNSNHFGRT